LTYSRSAWVGAVVATGFVIVLLYGRIRDLGRRPSGSVTEGVWRRAVAIGAAALTLVVVFAASGGSSFVLATLTGRETSAAGRPSSLAAGLEVLLHSPLGQGVTAAGPKALSINATAVLTENWYLVYGIQLGWLALACLCAFLGVCLILLMRRVRAALSARRALTEQDAFRLGAVSALAAALVGALFIPALLDLPASLTLWVYVAVALGPDAAISGSAGLLDPAGSPSEVRTGGDIQ
jgi:O-Antigen ligase